MFELRYAKMPEEPLVPPSRSLLVKAGKGGGVSEGSDQSHSEESEGETSSSGESESETERASQLSYLQKQVSPSLHMMTTPRDVTI